MWVYILPQQVLHVLEEVYRWVLFTFYLFNDKCFWTQRTADMFFFFVALLSQCSMSVSFPLGWNIWFWKKGMLQHSFGWAVIFVALQHFIAPALVVIPCLPSRWKRYAIRALNPRREHESAAKITAPEGFFLGTF